MPGFVVIPLVEEVRGGGGVINQDPVGILGYVVSGCSYSHRQAKEPEVIPKTSAVT